MSRSLSRRCAAHILSTALLFASALAGPAAAEGVFDGGKLLLTNGVSTIEGTSGGGLATWATIGGRGTDAGIGLSAHATVVELPDYGFQSHGVSVGLFNRVELSYARQNFDTRDVGTALGLGKGFTFNQDIFAAKLRLAGDVVYGDPLMPQIAVGIEHKRSADTAVVRAVGAAEGSGTDFTLSATKLFLSHSLLVNTTVRLTKANQNGLLGFGSAAHDDHSLQFEGSVAYQLSRRAVIGAEYRTKPSNLAIAREDDWWDVFAAYAITNNIMITAAYVDLGSIATFDRQRGGFLSAQLAF
ncbi:DUF3034 family protein [Sphingosinicella soli]|uniref:DUF3034 domain-containing protein n=1 Tax=Sphingosinicella soli TaxID=333708 RepID=A0A7W7F5P2_9SPHN|nr:DUF3034 family protein [Sphingosinicella soli]MBB4631655.1 hypothetical protein [Sphingosinicella soli]